MKRKAGETKTVEVEVSVDHGAITFSRCCLHALPGDRIVWKLDGKRAYAVIVKDFVTPLEWGSAVAAKGAKAVRSYVRDDAEYGMYAYTLCAVDGERLLTVDPEIIVHPPGGRGGRG